MPEFIINCSPNSLLTYSKPVVALGGGLQLVLPPYFHVDFEVQHIRNLLETRLRNGDIMRSAGICLVPSSSKEETLYALRVEWNQNDMSDLVANPNNAQAVGVTVPSDLLPGAAPVPASSFIKGDSVWMQTLGSEYQISDLDMKMAFAFFTYDALQSLLDRVQNDNGDFTHIRFRRIVIKSKKKKKDTSGGGGVQNMFSGGAKENYQSLIAELAPTFEEKYYTALTGLSTINTTDADAVAPEYGHPCPPVWRQEALIQNGVERIGYGIQNSQQMIKVANGAMIQMGALARALFDNPEAQKLLKGWTLNNASKTLTFKKGEKIILT